MRKEMRRILKSSLDHGFRNPPVRWLMLSAPFAGGVGIYAFYAMQPYLLELYGKQSYAVAGLAAAVVAATQIIGGYLVPRVAGIFRRRTSVLLAGSVISAVALALIGLAPSFEAALALLAVWALVFAATIPVRQAFIRSDSVGAAGHRPVHRQCPQLVGRRPGPAGARKGGGRLELLHLLHRRRRRRAAGNPLHPARPT